MDFDALAAPFPGTSVHWRAQSLNREGTSAMALAYIDARDVMDRLDEVCGPANWQDSYAETPKGRLICTLSLRVGDEWIAKSDGAGDTDVEGEKGAISDALKRTAVKWGIGRYLYAMPVVWAECEPMKSSDGKLFLNNKGKPQFKKWTANGLRALAAASPTATPAQSSATLSAAAMKLIDGLLAIQDIKGLYEWKALNGGDVNASPDKKAIAAAFAKHETELKKAKAA